MSNIDQDNMDAILSNCEVLKEQVSETRLMGLTHVKPDTVEDIMTMLADISEMMRDAEKVTGYA